MNSLVQSQQALAIASPRSAVGDAPWLTSLGTYISRYSLVLILFWIGIQKFTLAEAEGIRVFITHSPFVSWMYSFLSVRAASSLIGTVEVSLAVLIALRPVSPRISFLASVGAILTFLTTVSFLFTTPGVIDHSHAVPLLGDLGGFLIKDMALLGCAVWTARRSTFGDEIQSAKDLTASTMIARRRSPGSGIADEYTGVIRKKEGEQLCHRYESFALS